MHERSANVWGRSHRNGKEMRLERSVREEPSLDGGRDGDGFVDEEVGCGVRSGAGSVHVKREMKRVLFFVFVSCSRLLHSYSFFLHISDKQWAFRIVLCEKMKETKGKKNQS